MIYTAEELRDKLGQDLKIPDTVNRKLAETYDRIRAGEVEQEIYHGFSRSGGNVAAAAAAAAVVTGGVICACNPTFASNLPLIGHLFERVGDVASYSGDYSEVGEPVAGSIEETDDVGTIYTQIADGVAMTLSEVYCNDAALYLTFELQVEDGFPDCRETENGAPYLGMRGEITYSFNSESQIFLEYPDGMLVDENTYIGLLRFDLQDATTDWTAFNEAVEADEDASYNGEAYNKYRDLIQMIDLPESFEVRLSVTQIAGDIAEPISIFEAAGVTQPTEEEYAAMPEDEWQAMMQGLYDSVPDFAEYPNQYENFWYDGPYTYDFVVNVDTEQTVTVPVDTDSGEPYYVASVTKTPFELTVEEVDTLWDGNRMLIVTDANGNKLPYGAKGGNTNEFQVEGYDLSSIDIYSVSWDDWENLHIKGDYFEENETNENGQTLKEVLDENNLYHRTVTFD